MWRLTARDYQPLPGLRRYFTCSQREYIKWRLKTSIGKGKTQDILTTDSIDLLAMKLRTPLQVQLHLTLAMEAGYQTGEKPIPH
ncbi:ATPase AAA [Xenorhabdus thuongxuanensis]|uniref:ATPase AAA n=1 Tax=Xenorhabdus thuongxuanensis TaxID=1873484 RepID=A0A1Q5TIW4_9GAMM|nr:ATPase AAA [Xenorhabdus thuongxuanensis]